MAQRVAHQTRHLIQIAAGIIKSDLDSIGNPESHYAE
jgi:hypothetical protein